jgi:DNA-binding response OmpR family regulator
LQIVSDMVTLLAMAPATKRILVVDSDPNMTLSLEFLLAQNGFQVRIARSGEEALDYLAAEAPDVLLLDISLPYRSGFEICQIVRQHPEWGRVRIVLLSARSREVDIAKGFALGADAYVTKPFSAKELIKKVSEVGDEHQ